MTATARITTGSENLNRRQRRRIRELAPRVDKILDTDRRFFERHPERRFRVRLASEPEVESIDILSGGSFLPPPPGGRWFVLVNQIGPGVRGRSFILGPESAVDSNLSDDAARAVFEAVVSATPQVGTITATLQKGCAR